jgi:hypothetical protein
MNFHDNMNTKYFLTLGLITITSITALTAKAESLSDPNKDTLAKAMSKHLSERGDFCLGKFSWPIEVSDKDAGKPTRESVQMPVLQKLGLVTSSNTTIKLKIEDSDTEEELPGKRYDLTEAGKKYYLQKELLSAGSGGEKIVHHGDFCAGKLSLDKVVKWDQPTMVGNNYETTVTYTYKMTAAEWTKDPEIERVFPMLDRLIKGQSKMLLQQHFRLVGKSWVAIDPWE